MSLPARTPKRVLLPLLILLGGAAIAAYFVGSRPRAEPQPPEERVWPVAVVDVALRDIEPRISVFGEVVAGREAELRAMVAGRLIEIDPAFRDGAFVRAGARLAVIDPVDYEIRLAESRADLERARAALAELERERDYEAKLLANAERQVELAARGLERSTALARTGTESQRARDDADMALANAEQTRLQRAQTIARLETRIDQLAAEFDRAQAELAFAERELAHTRVVAPFDGHLADVRIALGHRVAIGESLGRLIAADELEVRFDLPDSDFARLLERTSAGDSDAPRAPRVDAILGRPVDVQWRLGENPVQLGATLTRVGAEIDPSMGGVRMYAALPEDATETGLRAGAFVEVSVADVAYSDVYVLPAKAVSESGLVYVLEDGRLREVEVEVLREIGERVVVGGGLDDGARVVANQFAGIGPGLKARAL